MRHVLISLIVVLSGCTTASKTYAPDGREAYSINCSGTAFTWGSCFEKAGSICGSRGYDLLTRDAENNWVYGASQINAFGGTNARRSMLVVCK